MFRLLLDDKYMTCTQTHRKCYKCQNFNKADAAQKQQAKQRKKSERQLAASRLRIAQGNGTEREQKKLNHHDNVLALVVMPPPKMPDNESLDKIRSLEKPRKARDWKHVGALVHLRINTRQFRRQITNCTMIQRVHLHTYMYHV